MPRPLRISDVWDAYVAGARDFQTYQPPDDNTVDRAADAYVKLLQLHLSEEGDDVGEGAAGPKRGGWYRGRRR